MAIDYSIPEANIRNILQLMQQAPPEEIRRRRRPDDLGPIEQRPQLNPMNFPPGAGPKLPNEELDPDMFPDERPPQTMPIPKHWGLPQ